ncbi:MAG: photosynthetic reaction center cytochrome c subunit [Caulobacteraceae bacterium]|nr:photosynthetic reaction center cytochrome c subunit [Caulobacter sp.]
MRMGTLGLIAAFVLAIGAIFILTVPQWETPPKITDVGYRGLNQVLFTQRHDHKAIDDPPQVIPAVAEGGPSASAVYKNVRVLTDVSAAEFMRIQYAITEQVAPAIGCAFCHTGSGPGTDWASDANPHKEIARVMLRMTRHINADWKVHVGEQGVVCYTCHRGQPMPPKAWFLDTPKPAKGILGKPSEFNEAAETVRDFFPAYGWAEYMLEDNPIQVESRTVQPSGSIRSWPEASRIYEMMMQMSDGMGVNCTYCHNTRDFANWTESPPARWQAFYGFKLTRDLNQHYVYDLRAILPQSRAGPNQVMPPITPAREMGPLDGNGLINCTTCHIGHPKPMNGANMIKDYPALAGPGQTNAALSGATELVRRVNDAQTPAGATG